jgi:hypothetical protein
MKFYVRGGVGDFLQSSWFMIGNSTQEFIIHTHFHGAEEFFKSFNLTNAHFYYFNNIEEHDAQIDKILANHGENSTSNIRECPRAFYSLVNFSKESQEKALAFSEKFKSKKPIIGIHPFGSFFSSDTYSKFDLPLKYLPSEIVSEIMSDDFNYIIFGSQSELETYPIKESDNVLHTNMDISCSLEAVKLCSKVIGTDSCFKGMAVMSKIPTFCILGDFQDPLRDKMFINQYEQDEILKVFRYKNINESSKDIIASIKEFLA